MQFTCVPRLMKRMKNQKAVGALYVLIIRSIKPKKSPVKLTHDVQGDEHKKNENKTYNLTNKKKMKERKWTLYEKKEPRKDF